MKYIYKISYPTGKIYIGKDLTGTLNYYGSANSDEIKKDFPDLLKNYFSIKKEILWYSDTASDQEVNRIEVEYINEYQSNNPSIGYNKWPKYQAPDALIIDDITIKDGIPLNIDDVLTLYRQEGWSNYLSDIGSTIKAYANSLCVTTAYAGNDLIGICRSVGDGEYVILIQDIIVSNKYKRNGIGKRLIQHILDKYKNVRQKIIVCDIDDSLTIFYKEMGFSIISNYSMHCMYKEY